MIDDRTARRLPDHIACEVFRRMRRDGQTLEEIDTQQPLVCLLSDNGTADFCGTRII